LVNGFQALAVARSRHYEWFQNGVWNFDVTSDFGRIDRQNAFMRAMIDRARRLYNPLTINSFLSKLPQGITLDSNFTLNDLIALVVKFHGINPASMLTYTLPTVTGQSSIGDVLYVSQPAAQQMLVNIFGSSLITPTNPPPNAAGQTPLPPHITPTTSTTTTTVKATGTKHTTPTTSPTTTTTAPPEGQQFFDPVPCNP
jgi:anionic cell wall polymer biosynthesis LytR-Cps2A-Psr (LCP) family protein